MVDEPLPKEVPVVRFSQVKDSLRDCPSGSVAVTEQFRLLSYTGLEGAMVTIEIVGASFAMVTAEEPIPVAPSASVAVAWHSTLSPVLTVNGDNCRVFPVPIVRPVDVFVHSKVSVRLSASASVEVLVHKRESELFGETGLMDTDVMTGVELAMVILDSVYCPSEYPSLGVARIVHCSFLAVSAGDTWVLALVVVVPLLYQR